MQILPKIYPRNLELINIIPPFLLGFLALSYQIFFLREFSAYFFGNEMTFGICLGSWLLWGGLGSILAPRSKPGFLMFSRIYYGVILIFPISLIILRFSRFIIHVLPGEMPGISSMIIYSLALSLLISFPLGILFVLNTYYLQGNLSQVYIMESLGASIGGLIVYLFIIPILSNWQGAAFIGVLSICVVFFSFGRRKHAVLFVFILVFLLAFGTLDFSSQKFYWKPFQLLQSKDTPYGKVQVLKTENQISLYNNNLRAYSYPDLASAEESVHFAMLQNPTAKNVLLIGEGIGGGIAQILKYPRAEVDYVELDPDFIRISIRHLPAKETSIVKDPRIHIYYQDGRAFLNKTSKKYDVILLNLPEPATAQINRFYTKEFFGIARNKMKNNGVFSFCVPSSENYISPERQDFLSSLYATLKEVFPVVKVVPGTTNIFLASLSPISLDSNEIMHKIEQFNIQNTYVSPQILPYRLSPLRVQFLNEQISSGKKKINKDFTPISYFYNSVLWSTQFRGLESRILSQLSEGKTFWILDFPLILFCSVLVFFGFKRKNTPFYLVPLALMGLTTIIVEIIIIISFQICYGYLYHSISLLFASFMTGLFVGALYGKARKNPGFRHIFFIQSGFILLLVLLFLFLTTIPKEYLFFVFLFSFGFLGGYLFIVSNYLFLQEKKNYGLGYGLDLLGSFIGALFASSLLIPLFGLPSLIKYLVLFNSFCLLFLVWGMYKK